MTDEHVVIVADGVVVRVPPLHGPAKVRPVHAQRRAAGAGRHFNAAIAQQRRVRQERFGLLSPLSIVLVVSEDDDLVRMRLLAQPCVEVVHVIDQAHPREIAGVNEHIAVWHRELTMAAVWTAQAQSNRHS